MSRSVPITPDEKYAYARSFPVHVGVDTGKRFHVLVVRGPDGKRRKRRRLVVSLDGFQTTDEYPCTLFAIPALVALAVPGAEVQTVLNKALRSLALRGSSAEALSPAPVARIGHPTPPQHAIEKPRGSNVLNAAPHESHP